MTQDEDAAAPSLPTLGSSGLWMLGLIVGLGGGVAILEVSPFVVVPAVMLWIFLAVQPPRLAGLAGAVVGHGVAWASLFLTSSMTCAAACVYSVAYGPAHVVDPDAWIAETRTWFAGSVVIFIVGLALSAWVVYRVGQADAQGEAGPSADPSPNPKPEK